VVATCVRRFLSRGSARMLNQHRNRLELEGRCSARRSHKGYSDLAPPGRVTSRAAPRLTARSESQTSPLQATFSPEPQAAPTLLVVPSPEPQAVLIKLRH